MRRRMHFICGAIHARLDVLKSSDDSRALLDAAFSVEYPGAKWRRVREKKKGGWAGRVHNDSKHFFDRVTNLMPTGLVFWVADQIPETDVTWEWEEEWLRPRPIPLLGELAGIDNSDGRYSYQDDAADRFLREWRGILCLAMNAGKTEVMVKILQSILAWMPGAGWEDRVLLILYDSQDLWQQTYDRFLARGLREDQVGLIGDGLWEPGPVTLAMVKTLGNRLWPKTVKKVRGTNVAVKLTPEKKDAKKKAEELMDRVLLVGADEAHLAKADTWYKISRRAKDAIFWLLLGGTPFRGGDSLIDDWKVCAISGPVLSVVTTKDLEERGVSAKPKIHLLKFGRGMATKWGCYGADWQDEYRRAIIECKPRNLAIAWLVGRMMCMGNPTLVSFRIHEHGEILEQVIKSQMQNLLPRAYHDRFVVRLDGRDDISERAQAQQLIANGETKVLIASKVFTVGKDIPQIRAVIRAGGYKDPIDVKQLVGRAVRLKKDGGDEEAEIFDFIDFHGPIYCLPHSLERMETYREAGFEIYRDETDEAFAEWLEIQCQVKVHWRNE